MHHGHDHLAPGGGVMGTTAVRITWFRLRGSPDVVWGRAPTKRQRTYGPSTRERDSTSQARARTDRGAAIMAVPGLPARRTYGPVRGRARCLAGGASKIPDTAAEPFCPQRVRETNRREPSSAV